MQAHIYESEGNQQQTCLLLFRHAILVLEHLPNHPDARLPEEFAGLLQAKKDVKTSLAKLDKLKPQINKKYEWYDKLAKERAQLQEEGYGISQPAVTRGEWRFQDRTRRSSASSTTTHSIQADENKDLAVQLARTEIKRRNLARKATRQAGIPEEIEQERRTGGDWDNWEEAFTNDDKNISMDTLSQQMQKVRMQVDGNRNGLSVSEKEPRPRSVTRKSIYNYPSIQPNKRSSTILDPSIKPLEPTRTLVLTPPPPPPKDWAVESVPPLKPSKQHLREEPIGSMNDITPAGYSFQPSAYLENGNPLRTLFLPPDLRNRFLSIAESNTRRNLETCGILCGTLISNALFISRLVIPEQKSTSDTCEMLNESDLFDYVDGEDLMVLGWIHTHPTQTCFMSSRDLHTHCGYQVMMPESIAIVCAPSQNPDWGVFRLTDPPGMPAVLNCRQTGLFHPHSETNIYTDALRPGHVFEARGLEFEVYDMRSPS